MVQRAALNHRTVPKSAKAACVSHAIKPEKTKNAGNSTSPRPAHATTRATQITSPPARFRLASSAVGYSRTVRKNPQQETSQANQEKIFP